MKSKIVFSLVALLMLFPLTVPKETLASGDLDSNKNQLQYVKSQIAENNKLIENINNQAGSVQKEIQQIDLLVQSAQNDIDQIQYRINQAEDKINTIQSSRKTSESKINYLFQDFDQLTAQITGSNSDYMLWSINTNSATALNLRLGNLEKVYTLYNQVVGNNAQAEITMKSQEGSMLIESNNLMNDKKILEERKNYISTQLNTKTALLDQLNNEKNSALNQVDDLEDMSDELESSISKAIKEMQERNYVASQATNNTTITQSKVEKGDGSMLWPTTEGGRISSPYGERIHPITGKRKFHAGIDIAKPTGTDVYAANDGVILTAGWVNGYGNTVIIDHGNKTSTLYGHNSKLMVHAGDSVKRGQKIAEAGSTGNSTGPHIHFEIRVDGKTQNPMDWF